MNANKWMKWLSVIALVFAISDVVYKVSFTFGNSFSLNSLSVSVLLLSVVAILISFKKNTAVVAKKK
jgi:uncharacterized membrane-anchored protein